MERKTGKEMAEELTRFLNSSSPGEEEQFIATLMFEHRTLQEETFKLFLRTIKSWSERGLDGSYDLRNEYTVRTSAKIIELLENG